MTKKQHKILCVMLANAIFAAGDPTVTAGSKEEAQQADNWRPYSERLYDLLDQAIPDDDETEAQPSGPLAPGA